MDHCPHCGKPFNGARIRRNTAKSVGDRIAIGQLWCRNNQLEVIWTVFQVFRSQQYAIMREEEGERKIIVPFRDIKDAWINIS